jgi:hypothetical protein
VSQSTVLRGTARFPDNSNIQLGRAKGAVNAIAHYGAAQRWEEMAKAWRVLNSVAARFPDNSDIQFWLAGGAANAINHYGALQHWEEMTKA